MNNREIIAVKKLEESQGWNEMTAFAWVTTCGCCAYCDSDLLGSPGSYFSGVIDHILPKSKYPRLDWDAKNGALSCKRCNDLKHVWDPNEDGEKFYNGESALSDSQRRLLIDRVRNRFETRRMQQKKEYEDVREIIRQKTV